MTSALTAVTAVATSVALACAMAVEAGLAQQTQSQPGIEPLATYQKLEPSTVTVSGVSSGAFFAHQFHVAYSSLVKGAGIIAGGPYACADKADNITPPFDNPFFAAAVSRRVVAALAVCTTFGRNKFKEGGWEFPDQPDASDSQAAAQREQDAGNIDDLANLASSRIWIFHGEKDTIVPQSTVQALNTFYELVGVPATNIQVLTGPDAEHGMPIDVLASGGSAKPHCDPPEPSYLVKCDYGAAERLLAYLYPDAAPQSRAGPGRVVRFDQTPFYDKHDESTSLNSYGYVYVPQACENAAPSAQRCRLHIAFHGCEQYAAKIDELFARGAGYDAWADANNAIVLYPQTKQWERPLTDPTELSSNPQGCWDWWGYSGEDYLGRNGKQMRAVRAMIARTLP